MTDSPVGMVCRAGPPPDAAVRTPGSEAPLTISLIAAAVAVGRMPGEPARVLEPRPEPPLLAGLFGRRRPSPLADPRLEVLRAISARLSRGAAQIGEELLTAAHRAGWTIDDLRRTFPGVPMRLPG